MSTLRRRRPLAIAARPDVNIWTTPLVKASIIAMAFFANSNFSDALVPGAEQSNVQQFIVIATWLAIIFASYFRRQIFSIDTTLGVQVMIAFYALAAASIAWSADPAAGVSKAFALLVTTFGAYRLAMTITLDEIIDCANHGLFMLCALSIALALLVPSIGIVSDWQHAGQWKGMFTTKQSLGLVGAMALFLACYRLMSSSRRLYNGLAVVAAIVCVLGSGSRGGGAIAACAVLGVYAIRRWPRSAAALAFIPLVMCIIGVILIAYMVATGNRNIEVFDAEINFTERTYIWQHALSYFPSHPWLGYGLNGFWTLKEVKDVFIERNRWFLDNYHDGYIGIVMETGVIGLGLFVAAYYLYGRRLRRMVQRGGALPPFIAITLVYSCLVFVIDITETYFLRSTNMVATLLLMSFFLAHARPHVRHR